MSRTTSRLVPLALAAALALGAACGPRLVVRHLDPGNPEASVWVDGQQRTLVRYGEERSLPLEPGPHVLEARVPKSEMSPWHPDEDGVPFVLDDEAILTLLPVAPGP